MAVRRIRKACQRTSSGFRVGGWIPSRAPTPAVSCGLVAAEQAAAGRCGLSTDESSAAVPEEMPGENRQADEEPGTSHLHDHRGDSFDALPQLDQEGSAAPMPDSRSTDAPVLASADDVSWGLRRGHVMVVAVLLLVAVVGAAIMLLRNRPVQEVVPRPTVTATLLASASPATAASPTQPSPPAIVVHVAGKVRNPGVIRLPAGARVLDAIDAAGGAIRRADLDRLNLARPLVDGEQVFVGAGPGAVAGGSAAVPSVPAATAGEPGGLLNLNTATLEQLTELPGIGPVLAQRIIEFRTAQGRFTSVEELRNVTGIGERRFAELRELVTV